MSQEDFPNVKELMSRPANEIEAFLAGIYEHSQWVATEFSQQRDTHSSIETVTALATAMKIIVDNACHERKMELLNAHPDLCEKVGKFEELTDSSKEEQSRAGLSSLTSAEMERFTMLNTSYKQKFSFPFILAVRNASKYTVLAALDGRLPNPVEKEFVAALEQVHKIAWMRLLANLNTQGSQGFLTCHVLDTANGCPAAKMRIELHRISPEEDAGLVGEFVTNEDGRLDSGPALKGRNFKVGIYQWTFYVADYFASRGSTTAGQPFLDEIPLRFGIDNPDDHYHVPLLVSPW
eukprot:CAMPEP_0195525126 /NCGR_PEP_ID=MMETSP0794_2-20130614/25377_1 /TAXON_ID=515487 /ORGANISM="Stephanopyxis turris, Strain CCMP 815" /LENGTH=292 /DNA_ID=CAMNT_0040655501 /DNA_START=167 /DNA_END=1042 /DNA_ORIENTATION=+